MKKSVGELSLVVVVMVAVLAISSIVYLMINTYGKVFFSFFSDKFSESDGKRNLSDNSSLVYYNSGVSDYNKDSNVQKVIGIDNKKEISYVSDDEKNDLRDVTKSKIGNNVYDFGYYKIGNNKYIVSSSDKNNNYYYSYSRKKSFFGNDKYVVSDTYKKDIDDSRKSSNDLKSHEENKDFSIDGDYDESFLSMANVTSKRSFSEDNDLALSIYNDNILNIVLLNTYNNDVLVNSATGFFVCPGIILTSWTYVKDSLRSGNAIVANTSSKDSYVISGIISMDIDSDIAFLKLDNKVGTGVELDSISSGEEFVLLGSFSGFGFSGKIGVNISNGDLQTNSLYVSYSNIGSPLFNSRGKVIGMVSGHVIDKDVTNSISSNYFKSFVDSYKNVDFSSIKYKTFDDLAVNYYRYNVKNIKSNPHIVDDIWNKYKDIGDIDNSISLRLVGASSLDNKISLRYKNDTGIENDYVLSSFISNLLSSNYRRVLDTNKKKIYKGGKFDVVIFYEFDYIIILIGDNL